MKRLYLYKHRQELFDAYTHVLCFRPQPVTVDQEWPDLQKRLFDGRARRKKLAAIGEELHLQGTSWRRAVSEDRRAAYDKALEELRLVIIALEKGDPRE